MSTLICSDPAVEKQTYFVVNSKQLTLTKFQTHLEKKKIQKDEINKKLKKTSHVLLQVKAEVKSDPASDRYVLGLLSSSEEKLLKFLEDLDHTELNK